MASVGAYKRRLSTTSLVLQLFSPFIPIHEPFLPNFGLVEHSLSGTVFFRSRGGSTYRDSTVVPDKREELKAQEFT